MARSSLVDEVLEHVGREIADGAIAEGAVLNSDQLTQRFNVSRTVIREVTRILETLGIVRIQRRVGVTVQPFVTWNNLDPIVIRWRLAGRDRAAALSQLTELRETVEPAAARRAATAADSRDLERLDAAVAAMDEAVRREDHAAFTAADLEFHSALMAASGNELFVALARSIRGVIDGQSDTGVLPAESARSVLLHRRIAEAVAARDERRTLEATRDLFQDMRRDFPPLAP